MNDAQTLGGRVLEAVIVSVATTGAVWLFQNPIGAGELVERAVGFLGQVDPVWASVAAWVAGILLAPAIAITVLRRTVWGSSWLFGTWPITGASFVFALIATSLWMCAGGNVWGLVPAALAVWFAARVGLRVRRAWTRFWSPAII